MDNHGFDSENSDKNKKVYSKFCMVKHSNNKFQKSSNIW